MFRVGWAPLESGGDIPGRFPERHAGRSLRFRWWVDFFNRTGCIRNVAGGRLPPLRSHRWAVPFNRRGSIREVPGTAHRPFPTVSLVGGFFHPHGLYSSRCLAMNHRRYIAWFHLTATFRIQPVGLNGTTPRHVIPRERMRVEESSQVADFILWWFFHRRGGFLHSADAAVGMTYRGVVPLIRTGYMRNVAGGRLPPLRAHRWAVPFNRRGSIREVPGTAHRPFPTVSLVGSFFEPTYFKSRHVRCPIIVNC